MRVVSRRRYRWLSDPRQREETGKLSAFSRSIGLDVIITPDGRPILVELQHGFGRRGLIQLFPRASRAYRKTYWHLRRQCGRDLFLAEELRRICSDKICTYQHFARHQPDSFVFHRWSSRVEQWLDGLETDLVLSKPPRGSCGAGILVHQRDLLRRSGGTVWLGTPPVLLQAFVQCRPLPDWEGRPHVGCIRHIVLLHSDGHCLSLIHLPPYWRVSPVPLLGVAQREALTANISTGAYAEPVSTMDAGCVRALAEEVVERLVGLILCLPHVPRGPSQVIEESEVS